MQLSSTTGGTMAAAIFKQHTSHNFKCVERTNKKPEHRANRDDKVEKPFWRIRTKLVTRASTHMPWSCPDLKVKVWGFRFDFHASTPPWRKSVFCHQNLTAQASAKWMQNPTASRRQGKDRQRSCSTLPFLLRSMMQHWHWLNCGETRVLCNKDNALSSRLENFLFISACFLQLIICTTNIILNIL